MTIKDLRTPRLLLRPFRRDDEEIQRLVFADPEVARPFCRKVRTIEETREWLVAQAWLARMDPFGFWAIVRTADDALLGLVGLQAYVAYWIVWRDDPEPRHNRIEVEVSYALGREHWGCGYATEAGRAVVGYAFEDLGLPRIAYAVDGQNARSIGVMKRLGLVQVPNLHPDGAGDFLGVLEHG